ncbi:CLUMA_CG020259, isoform A [Clunio marinus]|uniref:limulus clotting factor C n=1 Tax=Clunio marinus TaxID=568069 RepID=A0A1J1J4F4_9DIPT|nr:CLUMA_CG020259, isoform A [Clunio marinus]
MKGTSKLSCIFFALTISLLFLNTKSQNSEPRIVNGFNVTSINGFKHQVSVRYRPTDLYSYGDGHFCGGSLINNRTVLTAAHCFQDGNRYLSASNLVVTLGSLQRYIRDNNTLYITVSKLVMHKTFVSSTFQNDIALLILSQDVPSNHPTAQPILLPSRAPVAGRQCQISGWGRVKFNTGAEPAQLKAANLTINSRTQCNSRSSHNGNVLIGMFCAGPFTGQLIVDSCQGDSGGPLMCGNELVGITSNGVGCAEPNYPGIYTDVHHYLQWIEKNDSKKVKLTYFVIIFTSVFTLIFNQI